MPKKKGQWFKGNVFSMPLAELKKTRIMEVGIKKPTALETKTVKGKAYSRYYWKPLKPNELF